MAGIKIDPAKAKALISSETDRKKLRNWMDSAKRYELPEVYEAAFRRFCQTEGFDVSDPLDREFRSVIVALEVALSEQRGKTVRLGRTRPKLERVGVRQTITDLVNAPQPSAGFLYLIEFGMHDMSAEALVIKYAKEFDERVVEAARSRLDEYGLATE